MKAKFLIPFLLNLSLCITLNAQLTLSSIFTDNMVLQRQSEVPIWGKALPDKKVEIITSWDKKNYKTITDSKGKWEIKVSTPVAGGPHSITVSTSKKNTITVNNILMGDVWICSGQSNMEMQMNSIGVVANTEIQNAIYPNVRLLTIDHNTSTVPLTEAPVIKGGWRVCSPKTVADFSAVAYFFGRDINQSQNIPIGLINVSFGGTIAEAWTSEETLKLYPYFSEDLKDLKNFDIKQENKVKKIQTQLVNWGIKVDSVDTGLKNGWNLRTFDDKSWKTFKVPDVIENQGFGGFDGVFWIRKEINIPQSWDGKELVLNLGDIDDADFVYFNGIQFGNGYGWNVNRRYVLPAQLAKEGKATIAIRVVDTGGDGGFRKEKNNIYIELSPENRISLEGDWKINTSTLLKDVPEIPKIQSKSPNIPTLLYNAMINPIIPYGMKGVIWYQGEANAGAPRYYYDIFPLLINDWRTKWNNNFPFYYVQLTNYTTLQTKPEESQWAIIRDAQLNTLHLSNTGMAVTIDVGEAENIHPKNKQDVGKRLAYIALAKTYGEPIPYSGPIFNSYKIEVNKIRISFKYTDGGLKTKNDEMLKGFTIAGADRRFYWADAVIEGDDIIVSCLNVKYPVAVRYAWAQNPIFNLYNGVGLPASPFRTDFW